MNLTPEAIEPLGWTLLHFFWQGCVLALLLALANRLLASSRAQTRYLAAGITLMLMLAAPIVTYSLVSGAPTGAAPAAIGPLDSPSSNASTVALDGAAAAILADATGTAFPDWRRIGPSLAPYLPALVSLWAIGVVVLSVRLLGGWVTARRLRRRAVAAVAEPLHRALEQLRRTMGIRRRVRLFESREVDVLTVVGWLSPAILVPASALSGLSVNQLRTILAHELAHVKRHDVLVNLLQTVAETVLFYHPAVWWVSRHLRIERENLCDDAAVSVCGDPVTYARALTELEGLRPAAVGFALAANGGSLLGRVRRLLRPDTEPASSAWLPGVALAVLSPVLALAVPTLATGESAGASPGPGIEEKLRAKMFQQIEDARKLGELDADTMIGPLIGSLGDPHAEVRERSAWTLGQLGDPRAIEPLIETLNDPSAEVREIAAWSLGRVGDQRAIQPLIARLDDASAGVRAKAAWSLGLRGDARAASALALATRDRVQDVREQAVWALGLAGDESAVEPLVQALADQAPAVRRRAAWALGVKASPSALEPLVDALGDREESVREQAAWALGMLGDARAVEALTEALEDTSKQVRDRTAWALGRLGYDEPTAGEPFDFFDDGGTGR